MFDDLDTECPACDGTVRFSLDDFARGRTVRCSRGHEVELKDEGGDAAPAAKAERDLEKSIEDLSRTFRFRL